ncbi:MAG: TolC family protein [Candidatus Hydrogenedentes bacterium]|nr:TolC family protein [Candidatus Hydrogenedentota bacterium]
MDQISRRIALKPGFLACLYRGSGAFAALGLCLIAGTAFSGCTTTQARERADTEVYGLLDKVSKEVPGSPLAYDLAQPELSFEGYPTVGESDIDEYLGAAGEKEVGAAIISLEKALELAVNNSREYQNRKEALYLQALNFTGVRQQYRPAFSGRGSVALNAEAVDVTKTNVPGLLRDFSDSATGLTGSSATLLQAYADIVDAAEVLGYETAGTSIEQERSVSGSTSLGVGMLMRGGANVAVSLTSNFLRFLTGDPATATTSALIASITQPLLGADRRTAEEVFTQAERDLLYAMRDFTRFRAIFAVDIASNYYRVIQSRDTVRNNYIGYTNFLRDLERATAEADVGKITKADLGRTKQGQLQAENNWVTAAQGYSDALDQFKIRLGLSTDAQVVLDQGELNRILERGPMADPVFMLEDAVQVAFNARLDYYTRIDQLQDVERQLKIASDGLKPDIALIAGARVESPEGDRFQELDFKHYAWNIGLDVDPKLNRTAVRNEYRAALISYERSERDLEEFEDGIRLAVRRAWRELEQARTTYDIQVSSLELSERRVLEQQLLLEIGQGTANDRVDAENDRIAAQNSVSRALVDHTIANLSLWRDMGILYIKPDGQWEEIQDVTSNPS